MGSLHQWGGNVKPSVKKKKKEKKRGTCQNMSAWGHSQRFRSHSLFLIFISRLSRSCISTSAFWFSFERCNLRPSDSFVGWRLSWCVLFVRLSLHKMRVCVRVLLAFGFNSSKVVMRISEMVMLL